MVIYSDTHIGSQYIAIYRNISSSSSLEERREWEQSGRRVSEWEVSVPLESATPTVARLRVTVAKKCRVAAVLRPASLCFASRFLGSCG